MLINRISKLWPPRGTKIFAGPALLFFTAFVLFFNFTLNSQNLPRFDGILYQKNYLYLTIHFDNVSFGDFLHRVLNGEFFHNSLIPFLSIANNSLSGIFPSHLALGFLNVSVIILSSIAISLLTPFVVFNKICIFRSGIIFLLLISQRIFWALGNGFFDLRFDMAPSLIAFMCYLCCLIIFLKQRLVSRVIVVFVIGMLYLVLARPPVIAFFAISTFISFAAVFASRPAARVSLLKLAFWLSLILLPLMASLIPRWPALKEYYFTMGYEAGQWPQFARFWTQDVFRIYGAWSVVLWLLTLVTYGCALFKPAWFRRIFKVDREQIFKSSLILVPGLVTFAILNYQGTYGNPYGYILFMISGGMAVILLTEVRINRFLGLSIALFVTVSTISASILEIRTQVSVDKQLIKEIENNLHKMQTMAGRQPYSVVFLTVAGTDCTAVNVMNMDHRISENIKGLCMDRVHSSDLGMETRINGRGDIEKLELALKKLDWQSLNYIPKQYLDKEILAMPENKLIYFWNLIEGDPEFGNEQAYLYSHRVADVITNSLRSRGAKKVLSSPILRSDIFELRL